MMTETITINEMESENDLVIFLIHLKIQLIQLAYYYFILKH